MYAVGGMELLSARPLYTWFTITRSDGGVKRRRAHSRFKKFSRRVKGDVKAKQKMLRRKMKMSKERKIQNITGIFFTRMFGLSIQNPVNDILSDKN